MKRRDFLAKLGASYVAAGSLVFDNPFRPRFRVARAASGKTLIVLFQKGGNDGLNTVVPYGDDDYYVHRPTLGVAPPGGGANAALNLDGFFGLHPALAALEHIYAAGDMAIMPAVHYDNASRSHFDAQFLMQTAPGSVSLSDGWLNRHLVSQPGAGGLRAVSFAHGEDASMADSLRGPAVVSAFGDITQFGLGLPPAEETQMLQRLSAVYDQAPDASRVYAQLVHDFGRVVIDDIAVVQGIDFAGYVPANGAIYPNSSLGTAMKQTAQLIKEGVGLEIAALTRHLFDTHDNQGGAMPGTDHYKLLQDFGNSIAALYTDLGALMSDVVILTMTEFGRTAKENASGGTDHGNASAWFAVGPDVSGGIYLGSGWPGLAPANLFEGRDLMHTLNYRDALAEVLVRQLGNNDLAAVLPEHSYTPIGFLPV